MGTATVAEANSRWVTAAVLFEYHVVQMAYANWMQWIHTYKRARPGGQKSSEDIM